MGSIVLEEHWGGGACVSAITQSANWKAGSIMLSNQASKTWRREVRRKWGWKWRHWCSRCHLLLAHVPPPFKLTSPLLVVLLFWLFKFCSLSELKLVLCSLPRLLSVTLTLWRKHLVPSTRFVFFSLSLLVYFFSAFFLTEFRQKATVTDLTRGCRSVGKRSGACGGQAGECAGPGDWT